MYLQSLTVANQQISPASLSNDEKSCHLLHGKREHRIHTTNSLNVKNHTMYVRL